MRLSDGLRRQARHLLDKDATRPQQVSLRRAVSAGYYALFQLLISEAVKPIAGQSRARRKYRHALSRAFDHATMAKACKSFAASSFPANLAATIAPVLVPADLKVVAETFVALQEQRHRADYNLAASFRKTKVEQLLDDLDKAVAAWSRVRATDEARFFLAALLTWDRLNR